MSWLFAAGITLAVLIGSLTMFGWCLLIAKVSEERDWNFTITGALLIAPLLIGLFIGTGLTA